MMKYRVTNAIYFLVILLSHSYTEIWYCEEDVVFLSESSYEIFIFCNVFNFCIYVWRLSVVFLFHVEAKAGEADSFV